MNRVHQLFEVMDDLFQYIDDDFLVYMNYLISRKRIYTVEYI